MTPVRKLFIHFGGHKTATTSLQHFLDRNSEAQRRAGIYWPHTGQIKGVKDTWGHHELAWALRDGDKNGLWAKLLDEINYNKNSIAVLISSEEFSVLRNPQKFEIIRNYMSGFSIHPIYYMRRQDQLLESIYKYHVKALGEKEDILAFSKKVMHRLSHANLIDCLSTSFGKENLILRIYDHKHIKDDIFSDFLYSIGVEDQSYFKERGQEINKGLSDKGVKFMRDANIKFGQDLNYIKALRNKIITRSLSDPWTRHAVLNDLEREAIESHFRDENRRIARDFFNRSELF